MRRKALKSNSRPQETYQVPRQALTLTIPALLAAAHVHCMVPGPSKAKAVSDALLGPVAGLCPASVLRRHGSATLYVDLDTAALFRTERGQGR